MTDEEHTELRRIYDLLLDGSFYDDYDRASADVGILRRIVEKPVATSYTVAETVNGIPTNKRVLISPDEVRVLLDRRLHVGYVTEAGERKARVFSKREAAIAVAQLVNDRFNTGG